MWIFTAAAVAVYFAGVSWATKVGLRTAVSLQSVRTDYSGASPWALFKLSPVAAIFVPTSVLTALWVAGRILSSNFDSLITRAFSMVGLSEWAALVVMAGIIFLLGIVGIRYAWTQSAKQQAGTLSRSEFRAKMHGRHPVLFPRP